MNILFIGDIFASAGRNIVAGHLQEIITTRHIDLAVANAENAAGGFGLTPLVTEELLSLGLDVLTSGNHIWDKRELIDYLPGRSASCARPTIRANCPAGEFTLPRPETGLLVRSLTCKGAPHMPITDCPFRPGGPDSGGCPAR